MKSDPPGSSGKTLGVNRGTEPKRLKALVRGELDWIVMKALEKDRTRRYGTANGFAADIQPYLRDEPVQACPPSAGYRLRKFVRRNRGPVLAVAAVLLMLITTLVLALFSKPEINRALVDRNNAFHRLEEEQRNTDEARRAAEQRAEEIRAGLEKLNAANVLLERGRVWVDSPYQPVVQRATARSAADAFDWAVELRPDHSMARDTRGQFFCRLGLYAEAGWWTTITDTTS